jgi:hypothetical protein
MVSPNISVSRQRLSTLECDCRFQQAELFCSGPDLLLGIYIYIYMHGCAKHAYQQMRMLCSLTHQTDSSKKLPQRQGALAFECFWFWV